MTLSLRYTYVNTVLIHTRKKPQWVTKMGKKLLLRLQKSNAHVRSHGCMNDNKKKDDHMVMIRWEQVLFPDRTRMGMVACYLEAR